MNYSVHKFDLRSKDDEDQILLQETVLRILGDFFGLPWATLDINSHIIEDLGGDLFDHTELIITIEERFGVRISDQERAKLLRPIDIVNYFKNRFAEIN